MTISLCRTNGGRKNRSFTVDERMVRHKKQQSSNFRQLLQTQTVKANPRRNLTANETKRLNSVYILVR